VNCDPIARWYRWLEYLGFGGELQRRRLAFLPQVASAQRALVLGDGDGRFLARLAEQNRGASIDCVDLSAGMLLLARNRAGDRVTYHQADALTFPLPEAAYDLIASHFFLDCFDEAGIETLAARMACAAGSDAHWLISEFRQPLRGFSATWARGWLAMLYFFFGVTTGLTTKRLVDHRPVLERHGFRLVREQRARLGLLASELWAYFR
jgi:ubiquinone/menaquinone biosynthesis C-methylase UbiE